MRIASWRELCAWLGCGVLLSTVPSHAAERSPTLALQAAKERYREADFHAAVSLLHVALQDLEPRREIETSRSLLAEAYLHLALSYCALGDLEAAKDAFRKMLDVDGARRLDPAIYAPKVLDLFERARLSLAVRPVDGGARRLPGDRWLTVELGRQQAWLSDREPFAGIQDLSYAGVDLFGRASPDFPARNALYVRARLPWDLGDVRFERRGQTSGVFNDYQPADWESRDQLPLVASDGSNSMDASSVVWSRPFWSGAALRQRRVQARWELGYRRALLRDTLHQEWWIADVRRRGHRTTTSELRTHGARGGLAAAADLGWGCTLDVGMGGTLIVAGRDAYRYWVYLPTSQEEGTSSTSYPLRAQAYAEARLQWNVVRLRQGGLHVAVTAFHEWGGPAGSNQPNASLATRGVSGVVGIDLGPSR